MIPIPLNYRLLLGVTHDVFMAAISIVLAFYLRLGLDGLIAHQHTLLLAVPVYTFVAALSFKFMGMNKGLWRYASVADLVAILKAAKKMATGIRLPQAVRNEVKLTMFLVVESTKNITHLVN